MLLFFGNLGSMAGDKGCFGDVGGCERVPNSDVKQKLTSQNLPRKNINNTIFKFAFNNNATHAFGSSEFRNGNFTACLKARFIEDVTTDVGNGVMKITRWSSAYIARNSMVSPQIKWQIAGVMREGNVLVAACSARRRSGAEA